MHTWLTRGGQGGGKAACQTEPESIGRTPRVSQSWLASNPRILPVALLPREKQVLELPPNRKASMIVGSSNKFATKGFVKESQCVPHSLLRRFACFASRGLRPIQFQNRMSGRDDRSGPKAARRTSKNTGASTSSFKGRCIVRTKRPPSPANVCYSCPANSNTSSASKPTAKSTKRSRSSIRPRVGASEDPDQPENMSASEIISIQ